MNQSVRRM